ncbi:MAG: glutathione S-transferase family protein [Legionella sp.]|nr:glutathione S-transferase family protein [Legionella sp.]
MIKLYQFPPAWNVPNPSPFCLKLETYLRMVNLPYEKISVANPGRSPKGKLPCVSIDNKKIGDSNFIIEVLEKKYKVPLDHHLNAQQKALALTLKRTLEEHLYFIIVYSRWLDPEFWPITKETFFGQLSMPLSILLPNWVQKKMRRTLYQQGIGRHSRDEIYHLGLVDLKALSALLAPREYCLGNEPSSIDACAFAFLANILYPPIASPLQEYALSQPHFQSYCERIRTRYFDNENTSSVDLNKAD